MGGLKMIPPTKQQLKLLKFINRRIKKTGMAPDYAEMMKHMRLKGKSGIYRKLNALEQRGLITRLKYHNRAINIVDNDFM